MSQEWIAALIIAICSAIINKIWNKASDKTKSKIDAAIAEAASIMNQVVLTAQPGITIDDMVTQLKGVASVALGRIGISPTKNTLAGALTNATIAAAVQQFVQLHPAPGTLTLPVLDKIAPVPPVRIATTSVPSMT